MDDLDVSEWCQLVNGLSHRSVTVMRLAATVTSEPAGLERDPEAFLDRLRRHRGGPGQIVTSGGQDVQ